jgi:predicted ATPase
MALVSVYTVRKISVLQGDPGGGKSMLMIDLIARLTTGRPLPDGRRTGAINVISQCSEDGLEDTIKPDWLMREQTVIRLRSSMRMFVS